MKIALIGTTASSALGFRSDLIKDLIKNGHEVYVFSLDYNSVSKSKIESLGAYPVDYSFSRGGVNPFSDLIGTIKLSISLKKLSPDLAFSYFSKPVVFGSLAAFLAGVKHRIAMLEGLGYFFTKTPYKDSTFKNILKNIQVMLYRISFRTLDKIIFLNPDDPIDLIKTYNIKVKEICILGGIGIELNDYPYSVPQINPVSFIFVGRLLAEKGIHEYVNAAKIVKGQHPESVFYVVGGIDEDNPGALKAHELEKLIEEKVVVYAGQVDDVVPWLAKSSVFVLPSYREGVPKSTQEAMAVGRAVITTDVPGCRETVKEGVNGFIVSAWSIDSLAKKMIYFIENPNQIEEMGRQSYKMAQANFDVRKTNEKLISFLALNKSRL